MNITEQTLTRMTVEQFDNLSLEDMVIIRNEFPEHYHRLWKQSIDSASDEPRHRREG